MHSVCPVQVVPRVSYPSGEGGGGGGGGAVSSGGWVVVVCHVQHKAVLCRPTNHQCSFEDSGNCLSFPVSYCHLVVMVLLLLLFSPLHVVVVVCPHP